MSIVYHVSNGHFLHMKCILRMLRFCESENDCRADRKLDVFHWLVLAYKLPPDILYIFRITFSVFIVQENRINLRASQKLKTNKRILDRSSDCKE